MARLPLDPAPAPSTRQRLLDAAAGVFARDGFEGATTREIARSAGVNEVTLFRLFKSKEKLLSEVVRSTCEQQDAALAAPAPLRCVFGPGETGASLAQLSPDEPLSLRAELADFARRYEEVLRAKMPFVRTMIGEMHRHREHEHQVMRSIFGPLKAKLLARLQSAAQRGELRADVDPVIAADQFGGMVFVEALRRSGPLAPEYLTETYHAACVEMFVRGIQR